MCASVLLPRTVSGFMVLLQQAAVLMSMACETTEGHVTVGGLCCSLLLTEAVLIDVGVLPLESTLRSMAQADDRTYGYPCFR